MSLQVEKKAVLWLFVSFLVSKVWTLLPESNITHSFFPYTDVQLTTRTYAWILCIFAQVAIIYVAISPFFVKLRGEIFIVCILFLLDIPDYLIFYSEPLFYLGPLPVEYGLIKGILFGIITLTTYFKE